MVGPNSEVIPLLMFGSALAGMPFAPVNFRLGDEQLTAVLQRLAPAVAVVDDDVVGRLGELDGVDVLTTAEFAEARAAIDTIDEAPAGPDDVAILLFTSGTTGEPKAAVLRHRHLTSYILSTVEFLGADDDEAQLVSVPAYHVAGTSAVLSSVFAGRRICYLPAFDTAAWVQAAHEQEITQAMVVPTMLGRILDEIERTGLSLPALRHVSYGGGRMPVPVIERAMQLLPAVELGQRLRTDRDQLDDRRARTRGPPHRLRQRRPHRPRPARLRRAAAAVDRAGDPRSRRQRPPTRRTG